MVIMKFSTRCHADVQLKHELQCAREAVLCMEDTDTVGAAPVSKSSYVALCWAHTCGATAPHRGRHMEGGPAMERVNVPRWQAVVWTRSSACT